ncbi:hypothetical protein BDL97_09G000700 [Sphagnum fallax]|jgi:hypothetical protein|nr:hypothetical protein BDL97_09G000700 [Sphagnum fallax]
MGNGCNQRNGARTIQLAHKVATKAHCTIRKWNNKLRLKEREVALQQQEHEVPDENVEDDGLSLDRVTAIYSKKLSHIFHVRKRYRGQTFRKKVFEKLVCEPFLSPAILAFVVNCKALQDCATVCSSLVIAWSDLKYGNGKAKYLA